MKENMSEDSNYRRYVDHDIHTHTHLSLCCHEAGIADTYIRQKGFDKDEIKNLIKEDEDDEVSIEQDINNSNCYIITIDGKSQKLWIYDQSSSNEEN